MNHRDKQWYVDTANERRGAISDDKGPEYAGQADKYQDDDQDVLANFKRQDARWGYDGSGISSAFLYFGKHLDSIETYARTVKPLLEAGDIYAAHELGLKGEGILSRLDDARNYIDLIECLLIDAVIHPDSTPVYFAPTESTDWDEAVKDAPLEFLGGQNLYENIERSNVEACKGTEPCACKTEATYLQQPDSYAIHAFPEGGHDYGIDTYSGEKLYKYADMDEWYMTEAEAEAIRRHGVKVTAFREPLEGDRYLCISGGAPLFLTALSDHQLHVDQPRFIVRELEQWEREF